MVSITHGNRNFPYISHWGYKFPYKKLLILYTVNTIKLRNKVGLWLLLQKSPSQSD